VDLIYRSKNTPIFLWNKACYWREGWSVAFPRCFFDVHQHRDWFVRKS